VLEKLFRFPRAPPHRFAFYPSAPVRQAVLRISFWLAPSLSHRPTLRSTGEEDARCVEPTSATHSNYVHPHLVRSRLAPLVAQRGRPPETKAPDDTIGGPSVSRHSRPLRRTVTACLPRAQIPRGLENRAWAFSSHGAHAAEPLTPLSRSSVSSSALRRASPTLPVSLSWPLARVFTGWSGLEDVADRQAHRLRRLVKADASFWTGMPSIVRDPS